jgi:hypothetical protein
MVNIPRALFESRTGREPLYHVGIAELQDWTYAGTRLVPLKGFPGIVWERPKRKRRVEAAPLDEAASDFERGFKALRDRA